MTLATPHLTLSLISHTNAGKTTLARTLLRRDVGEVLDQAHVTEASERYTMLDAGPEAGRIELWDTPGFGDSARLLRELSAHDDPLGWLAAQHFDPIEQRALASSQRAVTNVCEHADVVLYLVNASEDPAGAGYVEPEMRVLAWTGKPVIVVLNHTGSPLDIDGRHRAEERWRWHLASHAAVRDVISLDAFTRCWVQEGLLLLRIEAMVGDGGGDLMARLLARWEGENLAVLAQSARVVARLLLRAAADREPVAKDWVPGIPRRNAARALAERLQGASRESIDRLIALHGLDGASAAWARGELADVALPGERPDPLRVGVIGGVVGGALGGLAADLASAGLSLGGGALAGAIVGGLSLGGLAWAVEQRGGERDPAVVWSAEFLERLLQQSLLRYLSVAHFGRGGGRYRERVEPGFWLPAVESVCGAGAASIEGLSRVDDADASEEMLVERIDAMMRECLVALYPGTERFLARRRDA